MLFVLEFIWVLTLPPPGPRCPQARVSGVCWPLQMSGGQEVDGKAGRTCALPVSGTVCQVLDVTDGGDNRGHRGSGLQEKAVGAPRPTPPRLVGIGRSPRAERQVAVSSGSWGRQGRSA